MSKTLTFKSFKNGKTKLISDKVKVILEPNQKTEIVAEPNEILIIKIKIKKVKKNE